MHGRSTPDFVCFIDRSIRLPEQILPLGFFNENVTQFHASNVKSSLIGSQKSQSGHSNLPTCDQNLIFVTTGNIDIPHDLGTVAKDVTSNCDQDRGSSFSVKCTCSYPQLSFDDWIVLESEDSWDSETTGPEMRKGSGRGASNRRTSAISVNEIVQAATNNQHINAGLSWIQHLSDQQANELVTQAVNSSVNDWCIEHSFNPGAVPESTLILAHAFVLASFWITRETVVLIADVMSADHA